MVEVWVASCRWVLYVLGTPLCMDLNVSKWISSDSCLRSWLCWLCYSAVSIRLAWCSCDTTEMLSYGLSLCALVLWVTKGIIYYQPGSHIYVDTCLHRAASTCAFFLVIWKGRNWVSKRWHGAPSVYSTLSSWWRKVAWCFFFKRRKLTSICTGVNMVVSPYLALHVQ